MLLPLSGANCFAQNTRPAFIHNADAYQRAAWWALWHHQTSPDVPIVSLVPFINSCTLIRV